MPNEEGPKEPKIETSLQKEDSVFVMGLRVLMENKGINLEDAFSIADDQIESSKAYDPQYPQTKKALQKAFEYLKSLEKK